MTGEAAVRGGLSAADEAAFAAYLRVRTDVLRLKQGAASSVEATPSRYWAEELSNIDYLLDASPLIVRKLRHHAFQITGIRPYDYREYGEQQAHFARRLRALIALAGDRRLLVAEHEALGGFGYRIDGALYNVDTLKFFEALVALRRAGLLASFEKAEQQGDAAVPRRLVWEIGAGWGGFAYQFKTLFPRTTYVIVDFPELFLFSATYLATVFPAARLAFCDSAAALAGWQEADFIFVPADRAELLTTLRPDLLVNLVSFQEMTTAQVERYLRLAQSAGCPAVYSLNRDRSPYNAEIDSVSAILARYAEVQDVTLLGSGYIKATKKDSAVPVEEAKRSGRYDAAGYRHLAGRLTPSLRTAPSLGIAHSALSLDAPLEARSGAPPRVGLGLTIYNRAQYLREALDSILAQSFSDFRLVLVDDGSTDGSEAIGREYEKRDARVRYVRHAERRGMVETWQHAFGEATAGLPRDGYFAWASDHDRWHPEWLQTLVDALDAAPGTVLAYPLTQRIDPDGAPLAKPAREFDTAAVSDRDARWARVSASESLAAGDIVYGLMRAEAVRAAGVFRAVLCPDRLLIAELTLHGQVRQVPAVLWYRRQFAAGSIERQRFTLFAPGARPPSRLVTPWWMHARALWRTYTGPASPVPMSRPEAARLIARYAGSYAWRHHRKSSVHRTISVVVGWPVWLYKRAKHAALITVYHLLIALRRAGIRP